MANLVELREQRVKLVQEARQMLDIAESEKRSLTAEEEQRYEKIMSDVDALAKQIEREERLSNIENQLKVKSAKVLKPEPEDAEERNSNVSGEYQEAFWKQFRYGKNVLDSAEYRALSIGSDSAGGYLVPNEFERRLLDGLQDVNVMRGLATVINTSSGDRYIPVVASHGTAQWTGENESYHDSEDTFTQVLLSAHKATRIIKVSEELLNDSAFDIESYLVNEFARSFGVLEEEAFVNGDGNGKPRGVLLDADVGVNATAAAAITADELIDLYHSLKRIYRRSASWLMSDNTVKLIRKLKDNQDNYLWQPGLQAGEPDRILGRPVVVSNAVPDVAANARSIAFGDFSHYWIADRRGRVFQRLGELYAANGQVGFRAYERVDGRLTLPETVKVLVQAGS